MTGAEVARRGRSGGGGAVKHPGSLRLDSTPDTTQSWPRPTTDATPTDLKPRPRPGVVFLNSVIHQFLRARPEPLGPAHCTRSRVSRSADQQQPLTSLNAPRPITFRISKSSLCSRASLSLSAMGSTGGRGEVRTEANWD